MIAGEPSPSEAFLGAEPKRLLLRARPYKKLITAIDEQVTAYSWSIL